MEILNFFVIWKRTRRILIPSEKNKNDLGDEVDNHEEITRDGTNHFGDIFRAEERVPLVEVVKISQYFVVLYMERII